MGKIPLKKEMATHSSILAWEIPRTEEPAELQSVVLQKIRESPLDGKEIQSQIFTGRTDAKAETPILWSPDVKN